MASDERRRPSPAGFRMDDDSSPDIVLMNNTSVVLQPHQHHLDSAVRPHHVAGVIDGVRNFDFLIDCSSCPATTGSVSSAAAAGQLLPLPHSAVAPPFFADVNEHILHDSQASIAEIAYGADIKPATADGNQTLQLRAAADMLLLQKQQQLERSSSNYNVTAQLQEAFMHDEDDRLKLMCCNDQNLIFPAIAGAADDINVIDYFSSRLGDVDVVCQQLQHLDHLSYSEDADQLTLIMSCCCCSRGSPTAVQLHHPGSCSNSSNSASSTFAAGADGIRCSSGADPQNLSRIHDAQHHSRSTVFSLTRDDDAATCTWDRRLSNCNSDCEFVESATHIHRRCIITTSENGAATVQDLDIPSSDDQLLLHPILVGAETAEEAQRYGSSISCHYRTEERQSHGGAGDAAIAAADRDHPAAARSTPVSNMQLHQEQNDNNMIMQQVSIPISNLDIKWEAQTFGDDVEISILPAIFAAAAGASGSACRENNVADDSFSMMISKGAGSGGIMDHDGVRQKIDNHNMRRVDCDNDDEPAVDEERRTTTPAAAAAAVAAGRRWATTVLSRRLMETDSGIDIGKIIVSAEADGDDDVRGSNQMRRSIITSTSPKKSAASDGNYSISGGSDERSSNYSDEAAAGAADPGRISLGGGSGRLIYSRTETSAATSNLNPASSTYHDQIVSTQKGRKPPLAGLSKNLVSERRRRKRLNEKLYSLRAIVPIISKMDKASIVRDAISYVLDLRKQVADMEAEVKKLRRRRRSCRSRAAAAAAAMVKMSTNDKNKNNHNTRERNGGMDEDDESVEEEDEEEEEGENGGDQSRNSELQLDVMEEQNRHRIGALDVTRIGDQIYNLRILVKKSSGVIVQLTRALESLKFDILNANFVVVNDHVINTLIIEVSIDMVASPDSQYRGMGCPF